MKRISQVLLSTTLLVGAVYGLGFAAGSVQLGPTFQSGELKVSGFDSSRVLPGKPSIGFTKVFGSGVHGVTAVLSAHGITVTTKSILAVINTQTKKVVDGLLKGGVNMTLVSKQPTGTRTTTMAAPTATYKDESSATADGFDLKLANAVTFRSEFPALQQVVSMTGTNGEFHFQRTTPALPYQLQSASLASPVVIDFKGIVGTPKAGEKPTLTTTHVTADRLAISRSTSGDYMVHLIGNVSLHSEGLSSGTETLHVGEATLRLSPSLEILEIDSGNSVATGDLTFPAEKAAPSTGGNP